MDMRTYAIGDVHGRADLLARMLDAIDHANPTTAPRVVFLGDIVDRGPASRVAMDLVCQTLADWPESRLIRGNHDHWFMEFMNGQKDDPARFSRWLFDCGGIETMMSYGLHDAQTINEAAERFLSDHPHHLAALLAAETMIIDETYCFVHAGIDPSRGLDNQVPKDLMMIRQPFLDHSGALPRIVVHGHTPVRHPEVHPYRIALDTGAYASNLLSCLEIESQPTRFMFASGRGDDWKVRSDVRHFRVPGPIRRSA